MPNETPNSGGEHTKRPETPIEARARIIAELADSYFDAINESRRFDDLIAQVCGKSLIGSDNRRNRQNTIFNGDCMTCWEGHEGETFTMAVADAPGTTANHSLISKLWLKKYRETLNNFNFSNITLLPDLQFEINQVIMQANRAFIATCSPLAIAQPQVCSAAITFVEIDPVLYAIAWSVGDCIPLCLDNGEYLILAAPQVNPPFELTVQKSYQPSQMIGQGAFTPEISINAVNPTAKYLVCSDGALPFGVNQTPNLNQDSLLDVINILTSNPNQVRSHRNNGQIIRDDSTVIGCTLAPINSQI